MIELIVSDIRLFGGIILIHVFVSGRWDGLRIGYPLAQLLGKGIHFIKLLVGKASSS